jgi:hypothetical protein
MKSVMRFTAASPVGGNKPIPMPSPRASATTPAPIRASAVESAAPPNPYQPALDKTIQPTPDMDPALDRNPYAAPDGYAIALAIKAIEEEERQK